jgi:hypothetical protein
MTRRADKFENNSKFIFIWLSLFHLAEVTFGMRPHLGKVSFFMTNHMVFIFLYCGDFFFVTADFGAVTFL